MKVIDLLKILLTQVGDIPKYIYFEDYKYEYDSKENDYFCEQLNFFLFMNVLGESLELNLDLPITIIEEDKEIEHYDMFDNFTGFGFGGTDKELLSDLQNNFEHINEELDYLIKAVNELRKGK